MNLRTDTFSIHYLNENERKVSSKSFYEKWINNKLQEDHIYYPLESDIWSLGKIFLELFELTIWHKENFEVKEIIKTQLIEKWWKKIEIQELIQKIVLKNFNGNQRKFESYPN